MRPWEGNDLVYFTNLLSWRCGLSEISYAINGGTPTVLEAEPCYEGESAPNALKLEGGLLPYVTLPAGSVQSIEVTITYDDGDTDSAAFDRAAIEIQ